jgi:hypothetical protein
MTSGRRVVVKLRGRQWSHAGLESGGQRHKELEIGVLDGAAEIGALAAMAGRIQPEPAAGRKR